jgi:Meiotically Up-regulated Gene 113 (MUG113) protein
MQLRAGKPQRVTQLYFIQAGEDGPIKIGLADRPFERLASLQTANYEELRLLAHVPVEPLEERFYHEVMEPYRIRGEWFRPDPVVLALVDAARTVMEDDA